jgi:hypothetical protein
MTLGRRDDVAYDRWFWASFEPSRDSPAPGSIDDADEALSWARVALTWGRGDVSSYAARALELAVGPERARAADFQQVLKLQAMDLAENPLTVEQIPDPQSRLGRVLIAVALAASRVRSSDLASGLLDAGRPEVDALPTTKLAESLIAERAGDLRRALTLLRSHRSEWGARSFHPFVAEMILARELGDLEMLREAYGARQSRWRSRAWMVAPAVWMRTGVLNIAWPFVFIAAIIVGPTAAAVASLLWFLYAILLVHMVPHHRLWVRVVLFSVPVAAVGLAFAGR